MRNSHINLNPTINNILCTLQSPCTLSYLNTSNSTGNTYAVQLMMEDFPTASITLSYKDGSQSIRNSSSPLSKLPVQFAVRGRYYLQCVGYTFVYDRLGDGDGFYNYEACERQKYISVFMAALSSSWGCSALLCRGGISPQVPVPDAGLRNPPLRRCQQHTGDLSQGRGTLFYVRKIDCNSCIHH